MNEKHKFVNWVKDHTSNCSSQELVSQLLSGLLSA